MAFFFFEEISALGSAQNMIGKTISHYKILEKLGEGGMAVVYKAEDTKLKRTVALKFLSSQSLGNEDEKMRFIYEAQSAAALDHSNICTLYEIDEAEGQTFIAMAYVEGRNLEQMLESGPLDPAEALDIAIQVAEGLQEAHERGIVHRDMKSANIMVTEKGRARIMDFGLAKLAGRTRLTKAPTFMGTVEYMSPEQTRDEATDERSDIWSLGVVLYEMLTGDTPFKGNNPASVIYKIINEAPSDVGSDKPGLTPEMDAIIARAMAKEKNDRYESVGEFLEDLRNLQDPQRKKSGVVKPRKSSGTVVFAKKDSSRRNKVIAVAAVLIIIVGLGVAAALLLPEREPARPAGEGVVKVSRVPSIAVLPFKDFSEDKDQEYFCDGLAEELIGALTQIKGLHVVARTSAFSFKGDGHDIRDIGKKLNVETVLEGSVRKSGNRLRVTAQLINVADGYHLWYERYDRDMADIFEIQDEITMAIVDKLKIKLLGEEKAKFVNRPNDVDIEAYQTYLKGRWFWNKMTPEGLHKGVEYFEEAIEHAPDYAPAYAGLADAYMNLPLYSTFSPKEAYVKAKAAAEKALELDNGLAEAHASLAWIKMNYEWDWEGAERECKWAIELNPGYAIPHRWYAFDLVFTGRFEEAIAEVERARELDPLSLVTNRTVGHILYYSGEYDRALEAIHRTIEMDPNFIYCHLDLGLTYLAKSMPQEALEAFRKEEAVLKDWNPVLATSMGMAYVRAGQEDKAREVLDVLLTNWEKGYVPPSGIARVYLALGEKEKAFEWLQTAYERRDFFLCYLKIEKIFDSIHSDPRYQTMLKNMNLEP
jgi:serine/threonine-protein kinase